VWTRDFIQEHEHFPTGRFKDQVDAAAGSFSKCVAVSKRAGSWGRH
jgi:phage terminase large subunit-like protein